MKLISNPEERVSIFSELMSKYNRYDWAMAWAGSPFELTSLLEQNYTKISKIIVGLHFFQTHPDFIKKFKDSSNVRFIPLTSELFHPKIYLFSNSANDWSLLIGSANFTSSGFQSNTETLFLVTSDDSNSECTFDEVSSFINESWGNAESMTDMYFNEYLLKYHNAKDKLKWLSEGTFKNKNAPAIIRRSDDSILRWSWEKYFNEILSKRQQQHVNKRIILLDYVHKLFLTHGSLKKMSKNDRERVVGLRSKEELTDWGFFGRMNIKNISIKVSERVEQNEPYMSDALDQIPINGNIAESDYQKFVSIFKNISTANEMAITTRLLTMKRPDFFVSVNNQNKDKLIDSFKFSHNNTVSNSYDDYWRKIIMPLSESAEWNVPISTPNDFERSVNKYRVAMLDVLSYSPKM